MEVRSDIDSDRWFDQKDIVTGSTFLKQKHDDSQDRWKIETLSEPFDPVEKSALFDHSMTKGLFKDIRKSPLK